MNSMLNRYARASTVFLLAFGLQSRSLAVTASGGEDVFHYLVGGTPYRIHIYTNAGESTFSVTTGGNVEVLVVGGGGGGGATMGGGGGAGGLIYTTDYAVVAGDYDVVVGPGGLGGFAYNLAGQAGQRGTNSSFGTELIAIGGGGGAGWSGHPSTSGGSGGGGNSVQAASAGTPGQGFEGDIGFGTSPNRSGGGGGGASEKGAAGTSGVAGAGGDGVEVFGSYYAGGGGGGLDGTPLSSTGGGAGGLGGGGAGSKGTTKATDAGPNTGGGGGGAGYNASGTGRIGGQGGSGIVIIAYADESAPFTRYIGTLANIQTGSTRFTNTNEVEITSIPDGYNAIQITSSVDPSAINPGAWTSTDVVPVTDTFTLPAPDSIASFYIWYTNTSSSVWLQRAEGAIGYTTNPPVTAVHATLERTLHPGVPVVLTVADIDDGTTGGDSDGEPLLLQSLTLACEDDQTPEAPYVTLDTPGIHEITMIATNEAGNRASAVCTVTVTARTAPFLYVSLAGANSGGTNWPSAFSNVHTAFAMAQAGDTIIISNGTYSVTNEIALPHAITVTGLNGAEFTELNAGNARRLFVMTHPDAILDGLTLARGSAPTTNDVGGGIVMTAGIVQNCILTSNTAVYGGGIWMSGGMVTNSILIRNPTKGGGGGSGRGGGINMTGGQVVDSIISLNTSVRAGAGIRMTGGVVRRSLIENNTSGHGGGGVAMESGGRLENCVIRGNESGSYLGGGGGVFMNHASCQIIHCTIVENNTLGTGGGIHRTAGFVTNSIAYYNTRTGGISDDIATSSEAFFRHVCSPDLTHDPEGTGNITSEPVFKDRPGGDLSLAVGSPCIDAGTNLLDVVTDIDGNLRPIDGTGDSHAISDIGAYEAPDPGAGPLSINFSASAQSGDLSLTVNFTAIPAGSDTDNLFYWWNYGDGTAVDAGYALGAPSHLYADPGLYPVSLTVSNASGQTATENKAAFIRVYAATTHVSTTGTDLLPYTNWTTAASNIQNAVDATMSGGIVLVDSGVYSLNNEVVLSRGVTVHGWGGRTNTIIQRNLLFTTRLFSMSHSNSVIEELTVRNGSGPAGHDSGGGIFMIAGTVRDCIVSNCTAISGGGITMTGGSVSNSLIVNNPTKSGSGSAGQGGGIYMAGGEVAWCTIRRNSSTRHGAGVRMAGASAILRNSVIEYNTDAWGGSVNVDANGIVENCLIYGNAGGSYLGGGGLYVNASGAQIRNSTVVGNHTTGNGGGVRWVSGALWNMIVVDNAAGGAGQDIDLAAGFGYSLSPDLTHDPSGTGNITNAPVFVENGVGFGLSHVSGNYRLVDMSPGIDGGLNQAWMEDALDLDGLPRIARGLASTPMNPALWPVDMGAYEFIAPLRGTIFIVR